MTVVNLPNDTIRLFCDLCPTSFQDVKGKNLYQAAKDIKEDGWVTLPHDKDHCSNICPACVARIKED